MRMWMVEPSKMCRKHLMGEHVETHMFLGSLKKRKKLDGFFMNNLFEPRSLYQRHKDLAEEMVKRGYNHNSPMCEIDCAPVLDLPNEKQYWEIDKDRAFNDLIGRCSECNSNFKRIS